MPISNVLLTDVSLHIETYEYLFNILVAIQRYSLLHLIIIWCNMFPFTIKKIVLNLYIYFYYDNFVNSICKQYLHSGKNIFDHQIYLYNFLKFLNTVRCQTSYRIGIGSAFKWNTFVRTKLSPCVHEVSRGMVQIQRWKIDNLLDFTITIHPSIWIIFRERNMSICNHSSLNYIQQSRQKRILNPHWEKKCFETS